ncbi:PREDICTED: disease resistance [Prunus dulcis]|uniref:PREDICTED: disease resistance n=1 Tax=Prunus dulcis TaxID=3755 RepID=A0A5E4G4W4_PRUDU|nr:disease resistance RPP13-like protein 4 [Prunus dulcis]VVA34807.1 PREDICTED: disease resistance [Prunus dulcis]
MSTRALVTTSFESPYVSLDLLSYLKSRQVTSFQIFNEVIMPDFLHQMSELKQLVEGSSSSGSSGSSSSSSTANNGDDTIVEEDSYLQMMFEEIQNDLIYIKKACVKFKQWEEDQVNVSMKGLVFRALDDAFKQRTGSRDRREETSYIRDKLVKTHHLVSMLKKSLHSSPPLSSGNLKSQSLQRAKHSMIRWELNLHGRSVYLPTKLQEIEAESSTFKAIEAESSTFKEIEAAYNGLDVTLKLCFLCFSVFPENAVIKKKVLVHWWVGEGFIDTLGTSGKTAEDTANQFFNDFIEKGLIKPVYKKRRPSADSCSMEPSVRYATIKLAKRAGFFSFDSNGNPTEDFTCSRRACLVKTEEGSSVHELPYRLEQEKVQSIINVNELNLDFRPEWFSKMKYVAVLQLGRWESSAKHLIQVEDSEFLKGLKNMRHLRYLSLRGVSRITELPASICKLSNLRILNLNGCVDLEQLPQGIGSLKNLTHLDMYECYLISHMPKGLALLSQLRVLKGFVIGEPRPGGNYCKLADLSGLENLRKLSIHVDKTSDAAKRELFSLAEFKKLQSLSISWSRLYDTRAKFKLRSLSISWSRLYDTPKNPLMMAPVPVPLVKLPLVKLNLHYFPGSNIPDWLMRWELNNLKKLYIRGGSLSNLCHGKEDNWAVKMVRLKFLEKLQMDWRKLQELFPSLTYLEIDKCPKLSFIPCDENGVWKKAD